MKLIMMIGLLGLFLGLTACSDEEDPVDDAQRIEQVADKARLAIDDLAERVGTDPQVKQDVITDCTPGNDDSGKMLSYTLHVSVGDDAPGRLRGEVADALEADGWSVKRRPGSNASSGETVDFQKDSMTIGASIFVAKGYAAVGGSGGCVR